MIFIKKCNKVTESFKKMFCKYVHSWINQGSYSVGKNISVFTWLVDSLLRKGSTMTPPFTKILSDGTLVPGIQRYFFANLEGVEKLSSVISTNPVSYIQLAELNGANS